MPTGWLVFWVFIAWVAAAVLQAAVSNSLSARRWRRERERRDRLELRNLVERIQAREDQAEARRWSKT